MAVKSNFGSLFFLLVAVISLSACAVISKRKDADILPQLFSWTPQKVNPEDGEPGDHFGHSVSVDGSTAVIGALLKDSNGAKNSGAAYIFERNKDGIWSEVKPIYSPHIVAMDSFGYSVSIKGDVIVAGALLKDFPYQRNAGAVFVYENGEDGWQLTQRLNAGDLGENEYFGYSVSVGKKYIAVGAPDHKTKLKKSFGAAYIFEKRNGAWEQAKKLEPGKYLEDDHFGVSVALSGEKAIVGAIRGGEKGALSGSAFIFENGPNGWEETAHLEPKDGGIGDFFGYSVSIDGDTAVAGASQEDEGGDHSGAVYVFNKNMDGEWVETQKLLASDSREGIEFGYSVDILNGIIVAGARNSSDGKKRTGSAYIFKKNNSGKWQEIKKITAPDAEANDRFGYSVSLGINSLLIGSPNHNDSGNFSGSAYFFRK